MLTNLLHDLHIARIVVAENRAEMHRLTNELQASEGYRALEAKAAEAATIVENKVAEITALSLAAFAADANKHPHPAIEIKEFVSVTTPDTDAAREWCFENFRPALALVLKTWEKAVRDGNIPVNLAISTKEPHVQIASDLSKHLV